MPTTSANTTGPHRPTLALSTIAQMTLTAYTRNGSVGGSASGGGSPRQASRLTAMNTRPVPIQPNRFWSSTAWLWLRAKMIGVHALETLRAAGESPVDMGRVVTVPGDTAFEERVAYDR